VELGIIQRLWRSLQQRVCSGFTPDSLFITFPKKRNYDTKIADKDINFFNKDITITYKNGFFLVAHFKVM